MKFDKKYKINEEFSALFKFDSKDDEFEHEAKMIMFKFLSELQKIIGDKPIIKKDLAKAIGTSASYITQLYNGDKLINLLTIAKIQEHYNITFEIKAKNSSENYMAEIEKRYKSIVENTLHINSMEIEYFTKAETFTDIYNNNIIFTSENTLKVA